MYSRYHPGYLSDYHTPTKIPAIVDSPDEDEIAPFSKFHEIHENGLEYFESSTSPVIHQLERTRRDFERDAVSTEEYLTDVLALFSDLDVPFHRKANALLRYLPLDVLEGISSHSDAANVFNKFACYHQAHDWGSLLRVIQNEKEYLLESSSSSSSSLSSNRWEYHNNENQYYTDSQLVPTPDSDRKQLVGTLSTTQTPVTARKRTRPQSPEIQVCPSLANL